MAGAEQLEVPPCDHEELIVSNFDALLDKTDIKNTMLLDKLMARKVFTAGDVDEMREDKPRKQLRTVLERIRTGDHDMFVHFIRSLEATGQGHIAKRYLLPKDEIDSQLVLPVIPSEEPSEVERTKKTEADQKEPLKAD